MTPEQFTYWLQGYLEVSYCKELNKTQTKIIKDHIALVFKKETPNRHKSNDVFKEIKTINTGNRRIC